MFRDPLGCQFLRQVPESPPLSEAEDQRNLAVGLWIHSVFGAYAMNVCLSRNSPKSRNLEIYMWAMDARLHSRIPNAGGNDS